MYDELGGDPRSTSAATCTRRHFEKLLLPFEKYLNSLRGADYSDNSNGNINSNSNSTSNSNNINITDNNLTINNKRSHSGSTQKSTQGPKKRGRKPKRFKASNDEESSGSVSSNSNHNDDSKMSIKEEGVNKKFETSKKISFAKENERLKTRSEVNNRVNIIEDGNSVNKLKLKKKAPDDKAARDVADYKLNDMKLIVKISRLSNNALKVKQDANNASYHDDTDLEDNNEDGDNEESSLKNVKSEETKSDEIELAEQSKTVKQRCDNLKGSSESSFMPAMSPLSSISTLIASMKTKKPNHSVNSLQPTSTPSPAPSEKSSRPSVIQKTGSPLKPCVKVVPTYKMHSICNSSGGKIISNLNKQMIYPPEAHKSSISKQNSSACLESRPLDLCIRSNSLPESPKDKLFSVSAESDKILSSEQQLFNHPPILDLSAKSSKIISANTVTDYSSIQKVPKTNKEPSISSQIKTTSNSTLSPKQTGPPSALALTSVQAPVQASVQAPVLVPVSVSVPVPVSVSAPAPPPTPPPALIQHSAHLSPNSVNSKPNALTRKLPEAISKQISNSLETSPSSALKSSQRNPLIGNRPSRNSLDIFYHTPISQPLVSLNQPNSSIREIEPNKHNLIKDQSALKLYPHKVSKASINNLSPSNQPSNQHYFNHNSNHFQNVPAISEYNPTLPFFHLPFASPLATQPAIGALYQQATNGVPYQGFNENLMNNIYSSIPGAPLNSLPYKHLFEPKIERSRRYSYFLTE